MYILVTVLIVLAGIIVVLLAVALLMSKRHYVNREIVVEAPSQQVFDFLRLLENQERFNKYATRGQDRQQEFIGTDGTVGFRYAWKGDKDAGQGEKQITDIVEGRRIETEIRFVKPMAVTASVIFEIQPLSDRQTKVNFINSGTLPYPLNLLIPMAERNFAKDMDESLSKLKHLLENGSGQIPKAE